MLCSSDRILITHVGSLPRNAALSDMLIRHEAGEAIDAAELSRHIESASASVIDKQVEAGVDIGNDGEQSRVGFQTYVPRCMCGFGGESKRPPARRQEYLVLTAVLRTLPRKEQPMAGLEPMVIRQSLDVP